MQVGSWDKMSEIAKHGIRIEASDTPGEIMFAADWSGAE